MPFDTIKYSLGNLKKTIQKNVEDNGLQDTLGKSFADANKATKTKQQIFNNLISPKGKEQQSTFINFMKQNNPSADRGNFVNDYLPSGAKESLGRMNQFSQMIGNKDVAKDIIKNNYFEANKRISPQQFLNKYDSLNKDEKQFLFDSNEIKNYDHLSSIARKSPESLNKPGILDLAHSTVGSGLGALGGMAFGHNPIASGFAGLIGANALRLGATKAMSYPSLRNSLFNQRQTGFIGNRMPITNALANAGMTNNFGEQQ